MVDYLKTVLRKLAYNFKHKMRPPIVSYTAGHIPDRVNNSAVNIKTRNQKELMSEPHFGP